MTPLNPLLLGALAMATTAVGLIFLRLWRDSGDRFFLLFALSFLLEGVNRIALAFSRAPHEGISWHYLVRLAAYVLIILAILDKNRPARQVRDAPGR